MKRSEYLKRLLISSKLSELRALPESDPNLTEETKIALFFYVKDTKYLEFGRSILKYDPETHTITWLYFFPFYELDEEDEKEVIGRGIGNWAHLATLNYVKKLKITKKALLRQDVEYMSDERKDQLRKMDIDPAGTMPFEVYYKKSKRYVNLSTKLALAQNDHN